MSKRFAKLTCLFSLSLTCLGQSTLILQNPTDAPTGALASQEREDSQPTRDRTGQQIPKVAIHLSIKEAEAIALKNNPAISVARLNALASQQVTREVRSALWPQAYANLTAADARNNSRITAGALNNPIIYTRAAGGATVSQLITDFGHTTNLLASARLQAKADEQNAVATKEDVLVATDQAFYSALQTHAVLKVAEQTVASRQLLADQVSALTKSKLKSDLDLSFANVNLAQAKLLYLDALNNDKAAALADSKTFLDLYYSADYSKERLESWLTYGSPRECIEHLKEFKASGCRRITFRISTMGDPMEQFRRVAEEVLPFVN